MLVHVLGLGGKRICRGNTFEKSRSKNLRGGDLKAGGKQIEQRSKKGSKGEDSN